MLAEEDILENLMDNEYLQEQIEEFKQEKECESFFAN